MFPHFRSYKEECADRLPLCPPIEGAFSAGMHTLPPPTFFDRIRGGGCREKEAPRKEAGTKVINDGACLLHCLRLAEPALRVHLLIFPSKRRTRKSRLKLPTQADLMGGGHAETWHCHTKQQTQSFWENDLQENIKEVRQTPGLGPVFSLFFACVFLLRVRALALFGGVLFGPVLALGDFPAPSINCAFVLDMLPGDTVDGRNPSRAT